MSETDKGKDILPGTGIRANYGQIDFRKGLWTLSPHLTACGMSHESDCPTEHSVFGDLIISGLVLS